MSRRECSGALEETSIVHQVAVQAVLLSYQTHLLSEIRSSITSNLGVLIGERCETMRITQIKDDNITQITNCETNAIMLTGWLAGWLADWLADWLLSGACHFASFDLSPFHSAHLMSALLRCTESSISLLSRPSQLSSHRTSSHAISTWPCRPLTLLPLALILIDLLLLPLVGSLTRTPLAPPSVVACYSVCLPNEGWAVSTTSHTSSLRIAFHHSFSTATLLLLSAAFTDWLPVSDWNVNRFLVMLSAIALIVISALGLRAGGSTAHMVQITLALPAPAIPLSCSRGPSV